MQEKKKNKMLEKIKMHEEEIKKMKCKGDTSSLYDRIFLTLESNHGLAIGME
jgi:hypothetical protein